MCDLTYDHESEPLFSACVDWVCAQGLPGVYFCGGAAFHLWKRTVVGYASLLGPVPWRDFDILCTTKAVFHRLSSCPRPPAVDAVLDISYRDVCLLARRARRVRTVCVVSHGVVRRTTLPAGAHQR